MRVGVSGDSVLHNVAVSTSGGTEQNWSLGDRVYSHILDPKTGVGGSTARLVSVIAPTGMLADPLTKVVLRMPGGKKSLLQNSRDICAHSSRATVEMEAHNGRAAASRPLLKAKCGGKSGKRKS